MSRLLEWVGAKWQRSGIPCLISGQHDPGRQVIGGFRCKDCEAPGADLDEMGYRGQGYVRVDRAPFDRTRYDATRGVVRE